jgi:hypothetical protein
VGERVVTAEQLLAKHGIKLTSTAPGDYATTCPECSHKRKPVNQKKRCLGVHIDAKGACWCCAHCGWHGPKKGDGGDNFDALYDYHSADGQFLFQKVRKPPGTKNRFACRRRDGSGWVWNVKSIEVKPLYRLPEIIKAIGAGRIVLVVEGEKDADACWRIGLAATCNFDGTSDVVKNLKAKPKWRAEYSEMLRGGDVVVLNDHDPPGHAHAHHAARMLTGIARRVRRLDLAKHWPDIPKGGDVSDWLALGHTRHDLDKLIEAAPDYAPQEEPRAGGADDDDAELTRLAKLDTWDYERARASEAKRLGVRASMLDRLVAAKRAELGLDADDGKQGHAISFPTLEPWPQAVDGAALLDDIADAISRHVIMLEHARDIAALWVVHSHLLERLLISPRLCIRSAVKGCGKTLLLDILSRLVLRPLPTANVTASAIFRVVESFQPCLLVDEADTFLRDSEELRGILNSGHRRGGAVLRNVGDDHQTRAFATFAPCAIALIGQLPGTLADRSVTIDLKRRLPGEAIEPFRIDRTEHLDALSRRIVRWAHDNAERVGAADPPMPPGVYNRSADNWRALLAIADIAAGAWPERARKAALQGVGVVDDDSWLEVLLGDIRDVFTKLGVDEIGSERLIAELIKIEARPWAEYGRSEKPITQNKLARLLRPVTAPERIRVEVDDYGKETQVRGYKLAKLTEAFERYLPSSEGVSKCHTVINPDATGTSEIFKPSQAENAVTVGKCEKSNNDGLCDTVTVAKGHAEENASVRTNGQGARPASERVRRVTALGVSFGVVGPAPPGAPCLHCQMSEPDEIGGVVIVEGHGRLHEACAPVWITNQDRSK